MIFGVTTSNPDNWDRRSWPHRIPDTYALHTCTGSLLHPWYTNTRELFYDGENSSNKWLSGSDWNGWVDFVGEEHLLSEGDVLGVTVCPDRSLAIRYNDKMIKNVFTALPQKPFWFILQMWMKRIRTVQPGM